MPSLDRESFTLLNLSESGSDSVPDLDLVQPTRTQNKRKVKYKRRERGLRGSKAPEVQHPWAPSRPCPCCTAPPLCRVGVFVFVLTCLGSLLYLSLTLSAKVWILEERIAGVDDASKTVPASILQIKTSIEDLQSNQTGVYTRLEEVERRLGSLEVEVSRLNNRQQGEDVQQSLADFGGKLAEVKQTMESVRNRSLTNSDNVDKLSRELNTMKLNEINMKGEQSPETSQLNLLSSGLTETRKLVEEQRVNLEKVNQTLGRSSHDSAARLDLFNKDLNLVKGQLSQLEDDNRNVSSRLLTLDGTVTAALAQVDRNLTSLTGQLTSLQLNGPEAAAGPKADRKGPRDKKMAEN